MTISEIFADNLRGKDYITARGLSPDVIKHQSSLCPICLKLEMLPAVLRLIESYAKNN